MTQLARRLGLGDAVVVGVAAMLGAGVFVSHGRAAAVAGDALLLALLIAAVVAWLNADSSARLAARMPTSGGTYAYARQRLTPAWGVAAGAAFLIGKTASAAAITLTVGTYLVPGHARPAAIAAVALLTLVAAAGARRSAATSRLIVAVVLVVLGVVTVLALLGHGVGSTTAPPDPAGSPLGVLQGAGIWFFAFAGYARIATLGEEVVEPRRTIPRAIGLAFLVVVVCYLAVTVAVVDALGLGGLAASPRPVADAAAALVGDEQGVATAVVVTTAAVAALASGLGVLLGLSRTCFAMARDRVLPTGLARLSGPAAEPRPVVAQVVIGAVVAAALLVVDLTAAITVSSVAVLVYYGIGHAAALTLPGRARRAVPVAGLLGCLVVAAALVVA